LVKPFVTQAQKVIGSECEGRVGPATVIAELHLEDSRSENLDDRAHLPADETGLGHIAHQSDDSKEL
jgi:hypothetical protein